MAQPSGGKGGAVSRVALFALLCLVICAGSTAQAQGVRPGIRGQPVRVQPFSDSEWRGHLLAPLVREDPAAYICRGRVVQCEVDSTLAVRLARDQAQSLMLRTGTGAGKGAIIGGAIGAGLVVLGALIYNGLDDSAQRDGRTGRVIIGTIGITGVGALIGGWIGSTHGHWERVW